MSNKTTVTSSGIGFFGLLTLIFITLKLTGFINWSWFLVLLPIMPVLILIGLCFVALLLYVILTFGIAIYESIKFRKKK